MSSLRVIVLGYVVRGPLGGMAWHHLQYVLGLAQLGHDVYFIEDSDDYPSCYDPVRMVTDTDPTCGLAFAANAFSRLGLGDRWAFYDAHTRRWFGPCAGTAVDICATADILLNVSGVNPLRPWFMQVPSRVLVDTDPAFTQIRHLTDSEAHKNAAGHTLFLTFGESIESDECTIPRDGFPWRTTRQPIVLDLWPVTPAPADAPFTTVMVWESYKPREYEGRYFGLKSDSLLGLIDLPRRTRAQFELSIGAPAQTREMLIDNGWHVSNPLVSSRDPWAYQSYIQQSKAEFSVAKHGYVITRSGWFSERSAAYLASGRPVVTEDTGFSAHFPAGDGLLAFHTSDEAVAAVESVCADYDRHCAAARALADKYFDARVVLSRVMDQATA